MSSAASFQSFSYCSKELIRALAANSLEGGKETFFLHDVDDLPGLRLCHR